MNAPEHVDARRGIDYIGVTVSFICHDGNGKVLMHRRSKNCRDEQGNWDNGGGALEFGEGFEQGVVREIKEEYGADATDLQLVAARNILRKNGDTPTHWVNLFYVAKVDPMQAKINEPEKMDDIGWFTPENLPQPLHSQAQAGFDMVKQRGISFGV